MSFLARANRAFKYELVSCVRAKHLIRFVHLSPFARRLLRLALTTRSKDERRQNTDQPNSYSDALEKMRTGVRERRASGPESHVEHQSSQFIANFSSFHSLSCSTRAALPSCSDIVPKGGAGSPVPPVLIYLVPSAEHFMERPSCRNLQPRAARKVHGHFLKASPSVPSCCQCAE